MNVTAVIQTRWRRLPTIAPSRYCNSHFAVELCINIPTFPLQCMWLCWTPLPRGSTSIWRVGDGFRSG